MRLTPEQQQIVLDNLGLAVSQADSFHREHGGSLEDLMQAARLGLCEAVALHDPARGRLSTVAHQWIGKRLHAQKRDSSAAVLDPEIQLAGQGSDRKNELVEDLLALLPDRVGRPSEIFRD